MLPCSYDVCGGLSASPDDHVFEVEMFSRVETGCAAVGSDTACCRSDRWRRLEAWLGREEDEDGVAPSRWLTVDRLGGAKTVVRRAMRAGTGFDEKVGAALDMLAAAGMAVFYRTEYLC